MDKITSVANVDFAKYLSVLASCVLALVVYIFLDMKKKLEKRVDDLENKFDLDHDKLHKIKTEHDIHHKNGE